jgi:hypothetical protein
MEWQDMLTPAAFVTILEKFFFPKWLQVHFSICVLLLCRLGSFYQFI